MASGARWWIGSLHRIQSIIIPPCLVPPHRHPVAVTKAIHIRQEFDDFKSFKIAMQDWALSGPRKFTFRFKKSDRTRNICLCNGEYRMAF